MAPKRSERSGKRRERWGLVGLLVVAGLIAGSCSSSTPAEPTAPSDEVTVVGLTGADGSNITIKQDEKTPPQLKQCLGDDSEVSQADFESRCVMPYVNGLWVDPKGLLRPADQLAEASKDWLLKEPADGKWPLYYPNGLKKARKDVESMLAKDKKLSKQVDLKQLPDPLPNPSASPKSIYNQAGLMFVPNSYVVPGGIFNEQYGWDSYFIIGGLLESAAWVLENPTSQYWSATDQKMIDLDEASAQALAKQLFTIAKGMADNQAFMIDFYGGFVPNANRIYYLTRSQPPLFAAESLLIYDFAKANPDLVPYEGQETLAPYLGIEAPTSYDEWIKAEILPAAQTYYDYYTDPKTTVFDEKKNPRVVSKDGKSVYLYHPSGVGPAPEIVNSQIPGNEDLYRQDAAYFKANPKQNPKNRFYDPDGGDPTFHLTQDFYLSDRSVRASGFDLSGRYGDVGQYAASYAPVALHSLLYRMAQDLNTMSEIAGAEAAVSEEGLASFVEAGNELMWQQGTSDTGPHYTDYWVEDKPSPIPGPYLFGTTFYPLWANLIQDSVRATELTQTAKATQPVKQDQVYFLNGKNGAIKPDKVVQTGEISSCKLSNPANPGSCTGDFTKTPQGPQALLSDSNFGIPTSLVQTGNQWDFSNAWAPVQHFAANGYAREGADNLVSQIDRGWVDAIDIGFAHSGTIIEKYSSTNPVSDVQVTSGYSKAQIGFGWTNGVYVESLRRSGTETG